MAPARGPPIWNDIPEHVPDLDVLGQTKPDFKFNRRIAWQPPDFA